MAFAVSEEAAKVLLLPPDFTRAIRSRLDSADRRMLAPKTQVDIMPALGTHVPLSRDERLEMFGPDIPEKVFWSTTGGLMWSR